MSMGLDAFIDDVAARAGLGERAKVELGTHATLRALGALLGGVPPALHDAIPEPLRAELCAGEDDDPSIEPGGLYEAVAARTEIRVGMALEVVQSCVAELGAHLAGPAREQLRALLPGAWAELVLDPRPEGRAAGAGASTHPGTGHTLATGRPGSGRPLADSVPTGQSHSIATSDDPHGDRRLAVARPGPQQEGRTLAEGHPGSDHPVSESD